MARKLMRHKWIQLVGVCTALALVLTVARMTMFAAIDLTIFELDGNAVNGAAPGVDWDSVAGSGAVAFSGIVSDPSPTSIFWQGGSKDDLDVPQWHHRDGAVPDKDDITNAYAVAYNNAAGDLLIYFGADRFANDGDAQLGFWFFQGNVAPIAGNVFSGVHVVGDLLILANFSNGGTVATIEVLEWVGAGGDQGGGTLRRLVAPGTATCAPGFTGDVCAIANLTPVPSPWPYTPKSGPANIFPANSFFEGGINISAIFGAAGQPLPCFTNFLAETRSSTSVNAVLKDFVHGQFPLCSIAITKVCGTATANSNGTFDFTFGGVVTNTGAGTLHDVTVTDTPASGTATPNVFNLGSLAPGATANYSGTINSTANGGFNNTAVVTAAIEAGGAVVVTATAVDACEPGSFEAAFNVEKQCSVVLDSTTGQVIVKVEISGEVCNTSNFATLSSLSATDDPAATITFASTTLAPDPDGAGPLESCTTFSGSYFPSSVPGGNIFSDTVTVTGTFSHGIGSRSVSDSASCPLCPPCPTCTP